MTTYQLAFSSVPTRKLVQIQQFLAAVATKNEAEFISAKQREHAFKMRAKLNEVLNQRALLEAI